MQKIKPPEKDEYIGISAYKSCEEGIGGEIKADDESFIVCEITPEGITLNLEKETPGDTLVGNYTHFTLVKKGWETMKAAAEISKRLGISRNRISFAGTKDKRAITAQRMSAYRIPIERMEKIRIKDIKIKDLGYSDEEVGLGSLWGNKFKVEVRGVSQDAEKRIHAINSEIETGYPNYYGHQRFGNTRPITHEVGRQILKGDFESAIMCYLTKTFGTEDAKELNARQELASEKDLKKIVTALPSRFGYEKAIINRLIERPGDYKGCLDVLPKNLSKMFIHAYQAYIFNSALSTCIKEKLSVDRLPLVGYETRADDISKEILDKEELNEDDFRMPQKPELKSKGNFRDCYKQAHELSVKCDEETAIFQFSLEKGAYATVLMREYMKN
jgi:tRNA pseudouridine13 synthase